MWVPQKTIIDKEILCKIECSGDPIRLGDYPPDALVELELTDCSWGTDATVIIYLAHERENPNFAEEMAKYEAYQLKKQQGKK